MNNMISFVLLLPPFNFRQHLILTHKIVLPILTNLLLGQILLKSTTSKLIDKINPNMISILISSIFPKFINDYIFIFVIKLIINSWIMYFP